MVVNKIPDKAEIFHPAVKRSTDDIGMLEQAGELSVFWEIVFDIVRFLFIFCLKFSMTNKVKLKNT